MMQGDQHPQISQTPSPRIEPAALLPPMRLQSTSGNVIRAPRPLVKSDGVGAQSSKPFPLTPSPDAVIHAPKAFSDANAPRRFSSGQVPGEAVGVQRPEPVVTPATAIDIDLPTQKTAQRDPQPIEQRLVEPVSRRSGERFETPQIPVSNAAFDLPTSGAAARREPKITIGQIDVQVINTPAPIQAPAVAASAAESRGFVSAELDRFRWRLR